MRPWIIAVPTCLLLAGCFMPASVANRVEQRDRESIRAAAEAHWQRLDADAARRGWRPVGEPRQGRLLEVYNERDEIALVLPATGEYNVAGFCGPNCVDMDVVVHDAARQRIGADLEPDAVPIAAFRGREGERVTVTVTIPDCRVPRGAPSGARWDCQYFLRVYRR